ncbi:hypothetical protein TcG_11240 [Trypanosoma cruzi]|nr:hypothetical protein TcG_11240 [Trypanosoma cruzi]
MEENTAVLCNAHALLPVVLLLPRTRSSTVRAHHPAQPNNLPSAYKHRQKHLGTCSRWPQINPHSSQTTSMSHHSINCKRATQQSSESPSPVLPFRKGLRSKNLLRAFALSPQAAPQRERNGIYVFVSAYICKVAMRQ